MVYDSDILEYQSIFLVILLFSNKVFQHQILAVCCTDNFFPSANFSSLLSSSLFLSSQVYIVQKQVHECHNSREPERPTRKWPYHTKLCEHCLIRNLLSLPRVFQPLQSARSGFDTTLAVIVRVRRGNWGEWPVVWVKKAVTVRVLCFL